MNINKILAAKYYLYYSVVYYFNYARFGMENCW